MHAFFHTKSVQKMMANILYCCAKDNYRIGYYQVFIHQNDSYSLSTSGFAGCFLYHSLCRYFNYSFFAFFIFSVFCFRLKHPWTIGHAGEKQLDFFLCHGIKKPISNLITSLLLASLLMKNFVAVKFLQLLNLRIYYFLHLLYMDSIQQYSIY